MSSHNNKTDRQERVLLNGVDQEDVLKKALSTTPPPKKPHPPGLIKRIDGLPFRFGGVEHSGWLPEGAAMPLLTLVREVVLDLTIESDGAGYLLCFASRDGSVCNDYWFERLEDADQTAAEQFGVTSEQWQLA